MALIPLTPIPLMTPPLPNRETQTPEEFSANANRVVPEWQEALIGTNAVAEAVNVMIPDLNKVVVNLPAIQDAPQQAQAAGASATNAAESAYEALQSQRICEQIGQNLTDGATSDDLPGRIVKRDENRNFGAGVVWKRTAGTTGYRTVQTAVNVAEISPNQTYTSDTYYALKVPPYRFLLQATIPVANNKGSALLIVSGFCTVDSWSQGASSAISLDTRIVDKVLFASKDGAPYILFKGQTAINLGTAAVVSAVGSVASPQYNLDMTDGWGLSLESDISAYTIIDAPTLNAGLMASGPGVAAAGGNIASDGTVNNSFGGIVITKLDTGVYEFRRADGSSVVGRFSITPENAARDLYIQYMSGAAQLRFTLNGTPTDSQFRFLFFPNA